MEAEDSSDAPSPLPAHSPLGFGLLRQSYWRHLRKTPATPKPYSERSPWDRKGSEDTSASPRVTLPALLCGGLSLDSQVPTPPRRDARGVTKALHPGRQRSPKSGSSHPASPAPCSSRAIGHRFETGEGPSSAVLTLFLPAARLTEWGRRCWL